MSDSKCSKCGEPIAIFGTGGGIETSKRLSSLVGADVPLLGAIPFDTSLREGGDAGTPIVIGDPTSPASEAFYALIEKLMVRSKSLVGVRLGLA
jgi:ATP-binding protein involved in chromosome partitioning